MNSPEYAEFKSRLLLTMGRERLWAEHKTLSARIETECSPQQKAAVYRAMKERNDELDYEEMYYSQF